MEAIHVLEIADPSTTFSQKQTLHNTNLLISLLPHNFVFLTPRDRDTPQRDKAVRARDRASSPWDKLTTLRQPPSTTILMLSRLCNSCTNGSD
jgi:hypothetical protein